MSGGKVLLCRLSGEGDVYRGKSQWLCQSGSLALDGHGRGRVAVVHQVRQSDRVETQQPGRGEKGLGRILDHSNLHPGEPNAMMAKFRIAELLGVPIRSVERFRELAGL